MVETVEFGRNSCGSLGGPVPWPGWLPSSTLLKLIESGIIQFYIRYVDDTLVLIKEDKINEVLNAFNAFDRNLDFTVDEFDDGLIHFLDLSVDVAKHGEIDIYSKLTNTGQYSHESSYVP